MTVPTTDSSDGVVWKNTNSSIAANTIYSTDMWSPVSACCPTVGDPSHTYLCINRHRAAPRRLALQARCQQELTALSEQKLDRTGEQRTCAMKPNTPMSRSMASHSHCVGSTTGMRSASILDAGSAHRGATDGLQIADARDGGDDDALRRVRDEVVQRVRALADRTDGRVCVVNQVVRVFRGFVPTVLLTGSSGT